jgi:hypothetical protein
MSRLSKYVATTIGRRGAGEEKRMQEIPELMPQLCFLLLPGVGRNQKCLPRFDHAFSPKGGAGLHSREGSQIL